jgi:hypothetical protein
MSVAAIGNSMRNRHVYIQIAFYCAQIKLSMWAKQKVIDYSSLAQCNTKGLKLQCVDVNQREIGPYHHLNYYILPC